MRDLLAPARSIRVVGIGGSAGAIEALHDLLPSLRPQWNVAFAIVLHRQAIETDERLESLLCRWSGVPLKKARDGDLIVAGQAVVAPANVHLIVSDGMYRLSTAPKENRARPSLDVTFRSLAHAYGANAGAVVLSGMLDDGASGIRCIRERGGLTIAQKPADAAHDSMPRSAIEAGAEHVLPLSAMPALFQTFARSRPVASSLGTGESPEEVTRLTCPDCGGVLLESSNADLAHFRCRVGHRYSAETLHSAKSGDIEGALWTAVQVLEEQVDLTERVARRAQVRGDEDVEQRMRLRAQRFRERAETVRGALPTVGDAIADSEARAKID